MKHHLITLLLLTITTPLLAQSQTLHLDKTRCQTLEIKEQKKPTFPYLYTNKILNNFCLNYLNSNKANPNAQITIWKKTNQTHQLIKKQKLTLPITFPILKPSTYLIISNDPIKTLLLKIKITNTNIQTKIFYNCAVHH